MISIGVKLFTAQKNNSITFNLLCPNGHKVEYKRYCPICQKEITFKDLRKGYYLSKSMGYVVFTQEEIKSIQQKTEKIIEVVGFTDDSNIDYLFLDKTYYILPQKAFEKPYFLFKELLSLTNKSAIAKITLRNKQKLCLIKSYRSGLTLTTLYNIDDVKNIDGLFTEQGIKTDVEIKKEELDLGKQLVSLSKIDFYDTVKKFKDKFKELFEQILKQKLENKPISIKVEENITEMRDLLKALKKSIEQKKKVGVEND